MKTKSVIAVLALLLAAVASQAATTVTATGSGEWNSTIPDQPWPGGVGPQPTDNAEIDSPFNVTVATNASVDYIYGDGTVTMGTNATLIIVGSNAGEGTQSLGLLDTTAPGNTVIYQGNAFWCKHQNYYNLSLLGSGNIYNGEIGVAGDGDMPMTIYGNLILGGSAGVAQGDSFTIYGNLTIGTNCSYDASCSPVTVMGNTLVNGLLEDLCGSTSSLDDVFSNITIGASGHWKLGDVVEWAVGGSLTNNGLINGINYASITFTGAGVIAGNTPISVPTVVFNGTNTIQNTITTTTNTPGFNGTLVFDLAHPGEIVVPLSLGEQLYYNGTLNVIDTGALPAVDTTYQFFSAAGYNAPYSFNVLNFPTLPSGYQLIDNLTASGSLSLIGLRLETAVTNNSLTVSWNNTAFPGMRLQTQTNKVISTTSWFETGVTDGPYSTTIIPTNPPVYFRLH